MVSLQQHLATLVPLSYRDTVGPNPALNRTGRYVSSPSVGVSAAGRLA